MRKYRLALYAIFLSTFCLGRIVLPGPISDGMVLQREGQACIYGKASPGQAVRIHTSWNGNSYKVIPGSDSLWTIHVTTGKAGGPYEISICQGGERISVRDVLLGEVWLCSGQSNMQMPVMGYRSQPVCGSFEALVDAPSHTNIRLLNAPRVLRDGKQFDVDAKWEKASITSVSPFSAVGYFYAVRLADALGVPVGMIEADWGGTGIESWMDRNDVLDIYPSFKDGTGINKAQSLFDCMIWPFHNYTVKGFLWYQGESNKNNSEVYDKLMAGMVSLWRKCFNGSGEKPFYYVMVAPFQYTNGFDDARKEIPEDIVAPLIWEAQVRALKLIPDSDIAVTADLGDSVFIHPRRKKEVADRLVMLAMHNTYGDKGGEADGCSVAWRGPLFKSVEFTAGKAIVDFDSPSTLCPASPLSGSEEVTGFEIAGKDKVFHKAQARVIVDGPYNFSRKVEVFCPEVSVPVAVRYSFHNVPQGNLTNSLGLPAFPFRTDNWNNIQ